ncbi:prefoldin subunit alpha [Candidatus Pacearchaeota archaeon CG10_big_fil_rev_8_21_14_0_10_34_12]|nr:MAG: prefoldin subunit alpha [Candidatus Pacearchaeota archaeon CG10_big_fil_rev_8_21_14_0_10_34_12]
MEKNPEEQQEIMFKLSMFEREIRKLQEQLKIVEKEILDLNSLVFSLDGLKGKKGEEVKAPVGRGIFIEAKLTSEELIVDVGGKRFVKKTISETQELIKRQIKKLEEVKKELEDNIDLISDETQKIIEGFSENRK